MIDAVYVVLALILAAALLLASFWGYREKIEEHEDGSPSVRHTYYNPFQQKIHHLWKIFWDRRDARRLARYVKKRH